MGGVTHEESFTVHQFCRVNNGVRIALGGTVIHNSQSFIEDVEAAVRYPAGGTLKYPNTQPTTSSSRHAKLT